MKIIVTSTSKIKVGAVVETFGTDCDIVGVKSNSGIPEQPYGASETISGAMNRITNILKINESHADLIISIENGIVAFGTQFMDIAIIIGFNPKTGKKFHVTSAGIPIEETDLVHEAVFRRKQEVTVGQLMAEKYNIDSNDPHKYLTNGISRRSILIQALKILKSLELPGIL